MDRRSRQNHRRRQARAPSVRFDPLVAGSGGLEVRLAGVFPVAKVLGGPSITRGEALRDLAELPWNPDAILANGVLDWTIINARTIRVAMGVGAERGEVTFGLNDAGLVETSSAESRDYLEPNGVTTARPWHGRFWDYKVVAGRWLPQQGEVAWALDVAEFVYWRGRLLSWRTISRPLAMTLASLSGPGRNVEKCVPTMTAAAK